MESWTLESGFSLPKLGLGTWAIGGKREPDYSHDTEAIAAVELAIRMGYTHIDTAESYGVGHCEELVGSAIKSHRRDDLCIATKVLDENLSYDDVIAAARGSIARLGVDFIDLYYIHAPNPDIPLKDTMRAFDTLVSEGLIKRIGVSNFTVPLFEEAQSYTQNKIVANQTEYSLVTREVGKYAENSKMESEMLPYCQANDVLLVAERPLERGLVLEKKDCMDEMVEKYGKSYAQIAINWLVSQKNVVTIPKATGTAHMEENLGGVGWTMEADDIEMLRHEYRPIDTVR